MYRLDHPMKETVETMSMGKLHEVTSSCSPLELCRLSSTNSLYFVCMHRTSKERLYHRYKCRVTSESQQACFRQPLDDYFQALRGGYRFYLQFCGAHLPENSSVYLVIGDNDD